MLHLVNGSIAVDKTAVVSTFLRKTIFGPSPAAALRLLLAVPFELMRGYWQKIVCAGAGKMDFIAAASRLKAELESAFAQFLGNPSNQLAFFPPDLRTPILRAGREQTLLRITYDGVTRLVEPYALKFKLLKDGSGQGYFYGWDQTGGRRNGPGIKAMVNGKITALELTDVTYEPRYEVEVTKAGEYGDRTAFAGGRRCYR